MRLQIDQFCAALGVPASLLMEARFSGYSTTQLQLLNSTIAQLAKAVNDVLTRVYLAIYDDDAAGADGAAAAAAPGGGGRVERWRQTAPLSVSAEVQALYTSGIIDRDVATPAAMHALGATPQAIAAALERGRAADAETKRLALQAVAQDAAGRSVAPTAGAGRGGAGRGGAGRGA